MPQSFESRGQRAHKWRLQLRNEAWHVSNTHEIFLVILSRIVAAISSNACVMDFNGMLSMLSRPSSLKVPQRQERQKYAYLLLTTPQ